MLHEPAIFFLDEPTSGVDPESRRRFWDLIYALAGEGVCVITTHYMDEAEYCNRIALISGGRLAALCSPGELKRSSIRDEILLVEGDNPGAMLEALEGAPAVRDVAPFGSSLHIVVDEAGALICDCDFIGHLFAREVGKRMRGGDLHLLQAGERPILDRLGRRQRAQEIAKIVGKRVKLKPDRVGGE